MKNNLKITTAFLLTAFFGFAQTENLKAWDYETIVVTWNKKTSDDAMNKDIATFAEHGVNVKFDNIKRNNQNEITAIAISYETKKGEKGALSYDNLNAINPIKIYKLPSEMGFGEPVTFGEGLSFSAEVMNDDTLMKKYNLLNKNEDIGVTSRTTIQRDGREPLIIENGKVLEGGSDYTMEELNEILSRKDESILSDSAFKSVEFNDNQGFSTEIKKLQLQIEALTAKQKKLENKKMEESKTEVEETKK
jgi:hypothetical protein